MWWKLLLATVIGATILAVGLFMGMDAAQAHALYWCGHGTTYVNRDGHTTKLVFRYHYNTANPYQYHIHVYDWKHMSGPAWQKGTVKVRC